MIQQITRLSDSLFNLDLLMFLFHEPHKINNRLGGNLIFYSFILFQMGLHDITYLQSMNS